MRTNIIVPLVNKPIRIPQGPYCLITIKQKGLYTSSINYEQMNEDILELVSSYFKNVRFLPDDLSLNDLLRLKDMGTNASIVASLIHEREKYLIGMTYDDAVQFLVSEILVTLSKNGYVSLTH